MTRRLIVDTLPELFVSRDDGCEVAPSCLRCPLPQCKFDDPDRGRRNWMAARQQRHAEARRLLDKGMGIREVAATLGGSERMVYRARAEVRS